MRFCAMKSSLAASMLAMFVATASTGVSLITVYAASGWEVMPFMTRWRGPCPLLLPVNIQRGLSPKRPITQSLLAFCSAPVRVALRQRPLYRR